MLCAGVDICEPGLKSSGLFMSTGLVVFLSLPCPRSLIPAYLTPWLRIGPPLPLRGRVARLPVLVRLRMNQSGDKAAGRTADATDRKLFNQAALPSRGQGETLHRRMKKKIPPTQRSHTHTNCTDILISGSLAGD